MNDLASPRLGIMDSGLGGLSLLADMLHYFIPWNLVYYADFLNMPYGNKSKSDVRSLVEDSVANLVNKGCEAIVIACNTATSVAVDSLRSHYSIPIFGMEPAIKPALQESPHENIAVLATELTLKEDRFLSLKNRIDPMNRVIPIACPGLADIVEAGDWNRAHEYLGEVLARKELKSIHSLVLGCTHYIFLEPIIQEIRRDLKTFHGNQGTINHLFQTMGWKKKEKAWEENLEFQHILFTSNKESDYRHHAIEMIQYRNSSKKKILGSTNG